MKSVVVYSGRTGNTKKVAEAVLSSLPDGTPMVAAEDVRHVSEYDRVFMGYWVDKGTADLSAQAAMAKISGKMVGIFATSGAYPDSRHALDSLRNGAACFGEGCTVLGTFICQGAVDPHLIERAKGRPADHHHALTLERVQRWRDASTHPDDMDLNNAADFSREILRKARKIAAAGRSGPE